MAIENSITFGGINSADFGIYISGEGVFDAPKRDAEMITIPGRNGAFVLDNGRFENITVTYPAFNFESDYDTFVQNLSDFRNAICAQAGYQRLTDTFHPDEYRMAAYVEGLEIKPIKYNTASQFDIVFDCKPQRWLTSGEAAVTVESGDTLTNPTRFESGPMLEVEGYGEINMNGRVISVVDSPLGLIRVAGATTGTATITIDTSLLEQGDEIMCDPSAPTFIELQVVETAAEGYKFLSNGAYITSRTIVTRPINAKDDWVFNYGTSKTYPRRNCAPSISEEVYTTSGTRVGTTSCTVNAGIAYDGDRTFTLSYSISKAQSLNPDTYEVSAPEYTSSPIYAYSTKSALGHPTYIDCDLGEAYMIDSGELVSLNGHIDLGSNLPVLTSGENEITFDNTITDLQVIPRWWKV